MFITPEEFQSHLYPEAQVTITRGDTAKIEKALATAQRTVARYLSAYNTNLIFGAEGTDKDKYSELILFTKDIAKWILVRNSNVQVDLELAKEAYDDAIKELQKIQKSMLIPDWPLSDDNTDPAPFVFSSQKKINHFY